MSDKDLLDDYLAGESELSDLYARSKTAEGSSETADRAILAAAKRELDTAPQKGGKRTRHRVQRWSLPLSTAAVVLISTTLYFTNESAIRPPAMDDVNSSALRKQSASPSSRTTEATPQAPRPVMTEEVQVERSFRADPQLDQAKQGVSADFAAPMRAPAFKGELSDQTEGAGALELPLRSDLRTRGMTLDADTWLEQIQALAKAGKTDQARRQLTLFVQAYPNASLPDWAKVLMRDH